MTTRAQSALAASSVLAISLWAAVVPAAGHSRLDGPLVFALRGDHGVHRGDLLGLIPLAIGLVVAGWCWRQGRGSGPTTG